MRAHLFSRNVIVTLSSVAMVLLLVFDGPVSGMHAEREIGLGAADRREKCEEGRSEAFIAQLGSAILREMQITKENCIQITKTVTSSEACARFF